MSSPITSSAFSGRVNQLIKNFHVPGISIATIDSSGRTDSVAFGQADVERGRQCTTDTIFDIASMSKALTAMCLGILVDTDSRLAELGWQTPVSTLIPSDFVMNNPKDSSIITLEDILSHRSGFTGHEDSVRGVSSPDADTVASITRNLRNLPSSAPVRQRFQYSNLMYAAATHIVEVLTGSSFSSFLHDEIFDKLEMHDSYLQPSQVCKADKEDRFATPYYWEQDSFHVAAREETPEQQGAGSIQSTVNDMIKLIAAMLDKKSLVTDKLYQGVTTPRIMESREAPLEEFTPDSGDSAYALGWDVNYYENALIISHDGSITGFAGKMFFLPEHHFGGIIVGNCESAFPVSAILQRELIDEVLGVPKHRRYDKAPSKLKKQAAQEARIQKNLVRNAERKLKARDTLTIPKENYLGTYHNIGYHDVTVEIRDGDLYISGAYRTPPYEMTLEHVKDNRKFRGYIRGNDGNGEEIILVEFRVTDEAKVIAIGLNWEQILGESHLFWHEKKPGPAAAAMERLKLCE